MEQNRIKGGVCAAKGFQAAGIHCGIRKNKTKRDLALIVSEVPASAAAIYTTNRIKGAPLAVTKQNLSNGTAQAVICNSGNANTCNANGIEIAKEMCCLVEKETGISSKDVIVASTGVIGQPLDLKPIEQGMPKLVQELSENGTEAAEAIMTTDTKKKECAVSFFLGEKECRIGGIAKGSGMIHPNMATMLVFLTTDVAISSDCLYQALKEVAEDTFHMISIDGDTSTNDMVSILANGLAGNLKITELSSKEYAVFYMALKQVTEELCRKIAADGEGATKLLTCHLTGAANKKEAKSAAKAVICSDLFKAAMYGADANWGRVLCALGYSGAEINPEEVSVTFCSEVGQIKVCEKGNGLEFEEEKAKRILQAEEIVIEVSIGSGNEEAIAWGCDLGYDYVKINGDYRT